MRFRNLKPMSVENPRKPSSVEAFAIPPNPPYIPPVHNHSTMAQQPRLSSFIDELRRRRVFRVAAFYGGIAFVIIQIIDGAFDYLHIPEWVGTTIIVLLLLGFPLAVALAWAFDITKEGVVRKLPKVPQAGVKPEPRAAGPGTVSAE